MQLNDRSGISCDLCHTAYREDFSYHSLDAKKITIFSNARPSLQELLGAKVVDSFDICTNCMDDLKFRIVDNYEKHSRRGLYCELSGNAIVGPAKFYYVVVTDVSVQMHGQPFICTKCNKKHLEKFSSCTCGNTSYRRGANMTSGKRELEFCISEQIYNDWVSKKKDIRSNSWTSNS